MGSSSNNKWRIRSRYVAILDLIVSTINVAARLSFLFVEFNVTSDFTNPKYLSRDLDDLDHDPDPGRLIFIWILMGILSLWICLHFWACTMLYKATQPKADPSEAMDSARIWQNVVVVFMVMNAMYYLLSGPQYMLALTLTFRGILLYIVCRFVRQLEEDEEATYDAPPIACFDLPPLIVMV